MNSSGLGGRVARRGMLANGTNADTSDGSGDDDSRGLVDGGLDGEKGRKSAFRSEIMNLNNRWRNLRKRTFG